MDNGSSSNFQKCCGRGWIRRFNNENKSFEIVQKSNNTQGDYPTSRLHGRGQFRGRRRIFRDHSNDGCNENNEGHKKCENDKITGPNIYIPPGIKGESFSGIEVGQNIDKYETTDVQMNENDPSKSMISFPSSGLPGIPINIPGQNLMACIQTDCGNIATYVLPILQNFLYQPAKLNFDKNHCEPQVVIMAPTRQFVHQIFECVSKVVKGTHMINIFLIRGKNIDEKQRKILEHAVHILTSTLGRLNYFVEKGIITLSSIKFLVLDEADKMLDLCIKSGIERVLNHPSMPPNDVRRTLMFSATFPNEVQYMVALYLKPDHAYFPLEVTGGQCIDDVIKTVKKVIRMDKKITLLNLLREMDVCQGTKVFVKQKNVAYFVTDFKGITWVVNYDLPKTVDEYVYQIGCTGRLENTGKAVSIFDSKFDHPIASELVKKLKQADQEIPSWLSDITEGTKANSTIGDFDDSIMILSVAIRSSLVVSINDQSTLANVNSSSTHNVWTQIDDNTLVVPENLVNTIDTNNNVTISKNPIDKIQDTKTTVEPSSLITRGFANYDSVSCYANSVVQLIFHCELLLMKIHNNELGPTLKWCLKEYTDVNIVPSTIFIRAHLSNDLINYNLRQQQDCAEFLESLMNSYRDAFDPLFGFQEVYTIRCTLCGHTTNDNAPITLIKHLAIPQDRKQTLQQLLENDQNTWCCLLDYRCSMCGYIGGCERKNTITSANEYIILQLKLFNILFDTCRQISINKITDLILTGIPAAIINIGTSSYQPFAAIFHKGDNLNFGHYSAYLRQRNYKWICADDLDVRDVCWPLYAKDIYIIVLKKI